jgi:hypothetical protein
MVYECRCDERLRAKAEGSTRLAYTGWRGGRTPKDKREVKIVAIFRFFYDFAGRCHPYFRIFEKRL